MNSDQERDIKALAYQNNAIARLILESLKGRRNITHVYDNFDYHPLKNMMTNMIHMGT